MERLRITVDGQVYDVMVEKSDASTAPTPRPAAAPAAARAASPATAPATAAPKPAAGAGTVPCPLAGIVKAIEVAVGAEVTEGQLVVTLEAMKMFTPINAPCSGKVSAVHVNIGDAVEEGAPLLTIA